MNENIKALLEKVEADQDLQAKFSQIKDVDEAYDLANSIQPGFTKEEFITEMTRIKDAMEENLTDADLAKSAGGMSDAGKASLEFSAGVTVVTAVTAVSAGVSAAMAI